MDDDRRSRLPVVVAAAVVVALPLLYVLAIGPVHWLMEHSYIDNESRLGTALLVVYYPVVALCNACPPLMSILAWYLKLWE